jgi:hypothetical protein
MFFTYTFVHLSEKWDFQDLFVGFQNDSTDLYSHMRECLFLPTLANNEFCRPLIFVILYTRERLPIVFYMKFYLDMFL